MTSDPVTVTHTAGMVGLTMGSSYSRTYWFSPLDALDLAEELAKVAEGVGADVIAEARARRQQSA